MHDHTLLEHRCFARVMIDHLLAGLVVHDLVINGRMLSGSSAPEAVGLIVHEDRLVGHRFV